KSGALFSQVNAQVPLTLPSHVSLFTSIYPFASGVEDNGQVLQANTVTLARVLKSRRYKHSGIRRDFVLDGRFGLDQGFDFYDSPFSPPREREVDPADLKRLGEDVAGAA